MKLLNEDDFLKMAKIKIKIKKLEIEYKDLEFNAVENYHKKYENKLGTFYPISANRYTVDNCKVAKVMGMASYKEHSKISMTGIIKGIGKNGFDKLLKDGGVIHSSTSYYYKFTAKK